MCFVSVDAASDVIASVDAAGDVIASADAAGDVNGSVDAASDVISSVVAAGDVNASVNAESDVNVSHAREVRVVLTEDDIDNITDTASGIITTAQAIISECIDAKDSVNNITASADDVKHIVQQVHGRDQYYNTEEDTYTLHIIKLVQINKAKIDILAALNQITDQCEGDSNLTSEITQSISNVTEILNGAMQFQ